MERAWILLGMMGAGKSAVGRALSVASGREFRDTDTLLQNKLGRPISQIFRVYGEAMFREHETSLLAELEPGPYILSTGGGIVIRPENFEHLRRIGVTLYLSTPPEILIQRLELSKKKRPLLDADNWQDRVRSLLAERTPIYEQADITMTDEGNDIEATAHAAMAEFMRFEAQ